MTQSIRAPSLVLLAGPTASGKSALARELAQQHEAEIVNLDAFQLYRGMRIGTAQPSPEERAQVPHWLYDFCDPRQGMSAAAYAALADQTADEIFSRGKRVIFVGGTGFYLRALLYGLFEAPPVDEALRASLTERSLLPGGKEALHHELAQVDPESASRLPINDAYRVTRALEVFLQTGISLTEHHRAQQRGPRYRFLLLALDPPHEELAAKQARRLAVMMQAGWLEEVRALQEEGITESAPGCKAIGYRALFSVLRGEKTRAEAEAEILREHKAYAKRQRTWLRAEPGVRWFSSPQDPALRLEVSSFWF